MQAKREPSKQGSEEEGAGRGTFSQLTFNQNKKKQQNRTNKNTSPGKMEAVMKNCPGKTVFLMTGPYKYLIHQQIRKLTARETAANALGKVLQHLNFSFHDFRMRQAHFLKSDLYICVCFYISMCWKT